MFNILTLKGNANQLHTEILSYSSQYDYHQEIKIYKDSWRGYREERILIHCWSELKLFCYCRNQNGDS
jgi:hypothetical protein